MNFLINGVERRVGLDLNGDGYVRGEGFLSRLERATHIDFNGDNIIGRPLDVSYYSQPSMYAGGYTGYPSFGGYTTGFGGYPLMSYGDHMHDHHHHHHHHYGYF